MSRILVADDDTLIRRYLQQALELGGYDVITAVDGVEAISVLDCDAGIDVVVTDHSMPRASGLEVIAHAHHVDPTLPCIIVTAFRDLDLAMRGMQAGAVGFIPKPFKAEHLLTVVRGAVERRELASEAVRLRLLAPLVERFAMVLASTLEFKDASMSHHSRRLVALADGIAGELMLDPTTRNRVRLGACLHDIGKVGIPENLLRKPTTLTAGERDVVRQHPQIGATILEDFEGFEEVRQIVLHHHEHFDGTGYPGGLRGPDIPVGARVVSVVDAVDVMHTGRPYAPAQSLDGIVAELARLRGRQFDPEVVDIFLTIMARSGPTFLQEQDRAAAASGGDAAPAPGWSLPYPLGDRSRGGFTTA